MDDIPTVTMTSERQKQGNSFDVVFLRKMDSHTIRFNRTKWEARCFVPSSAGNLCVRKGHIMKNQDSSDNLRAFVDKQLDISCQWGVMAKRLIGKAETRQWMFHCY